MTVPIDDVICGDALEILRTIPEDSVDLVFADPPYNIDKAAWDKIDDYLQWSEQWIVGASRCLKSGGAFWVSHSKPLILAELSGMVSNTGFSLVNWITWDKSKWSYVRKYKEAGSRSFIDCQEYLIYHANKGDWPTKHSKKPDFIFEPLWAYLNEERKRAGISKDECNTVCGFSQTLGGMAWRHYFFRSQWQLPTQEHYESLRTLFNRNGNDYLRREYEDLRREYENLRYTFNNPNKISNVWQFPPAKFRGHPTPKPKALVERIITATSNEGDLILDPFMGSGTAGVVARRTNRHYLGIELNPEYVRMAKARIAKECPMELLV